MPNPEVKQLAGPAPPVRWAADWPDVARRAAGYDLLDVRHFDVFRASKAVGRCNHGPRLMRHGGRLRVIWACHARDADAPGQRVMLAESADGRRWTEPMECFAPLSPAREAGQGGRLLRAAGWAVVDGTAYALAEAREHAGSEAATQRAGRRRRVLGWIARAGEADGRFGPAFWLRDTSPPPIDGFLPHPSARDTRFAEVAATLAAELARPLSAPCLDQPPSNDPREPVTEVRYVGVDGHRLDRQSTYRRPDGVLVRLFSDRDARHRLYASLSDDGGVTWLPALPTSIPDSPSRSFALSLPDGRTALIGNQVAEAPGARVRERYPRDPLVVSISRDGVAFGWAGAIRAGSPRIRHKGAGKVAGFQHPSAVVADGALWVAYCVGKEDIAVTPIPLELLGGGT